MNAPSRYFISNAATQDGYPWRHSRCEAGDGSLRETRPNQAPRVPLLISNPNVAGGKEINKAAFNWNRQFRLRERLTLQARADLFNIFNHRSPLFGQSTQMLGASLGSGGQNGGLNPLYQIGGPRSAQLALKILF